MPSALLKACPRGHPPFAERGGCPECRRLQDAQRAGSLERSARFRGARWRALTRRFRQMLIAANIAPVCGARLPGAPITQDSTCQAEGLLVGDQPGRTLHTDHIEPHRGNERLWGDVLNLQLLCEHCHDAKTAREDGGCGNRRPWRARRETPGYTPSGCGPDAPAVTALASGTQNPEIKGFSETEGF